MYNNQAVHLCQLYTELFNSKQNQRYSENLRQKKSPQYMFTIFSYGSNWRFGWLGYNN